MARSPARPTPPETQSITAAQRPHHVEMQERMVKYAISMGIRTACFVVMVLSAVYWHVLVLTVAAMIGAVALPYVAVLIANAGRERMPARRPTAVERPAATPLTASPHAEQAWQRPTAPAGPEHDVVRVDPTSSTTTVTGRRLGAAPTRAPAPAPAPAWSDRSAS